MKLQPVVAGHFYPGNKKALQAALKSFEAEEAPLIEGEPVGFLLPHAGYAYSGAVAALGYRALKGPVETVIVAGPSHYLPFRGVSVFAGNRPSLPWGKCRSIARRRGF